MAEERDDPPFEGGSQPVPQHPEEVPQGGRGAMQAVIVVIAILVVIAVLIWLFVPIGAS